MGNSVLLVKSESSRIDKSFIWYDRSYSPSWRWKKCRAYIYGQFKFASCNSGHHETQWRSRSASPECDASEYHWASKSLSRACKKVWTPRWKLPAFVSVQAAFRPRQRVRSIWARNSRRNNERDLHLDSEVYVSREQWIISVWHNLVLRQTLII